jgi:hypothetical protein
MRTCLSVALYIFFIFVVLPVQWLCNTPDRYCLIDCDPWLLDFIVAPYISEFLIAWYMNCDMICGTVRGMLYVTDRVGQLYMICDWQ